MKTNHNFFLNLAFNLAKINLGKTKSNPSVGCIVEKEGSVISSGYTSIGGRPHAEFNAMWMIEIDRLGCVLKRFTQFEFRCIGQ